MSSADTEAPEETEAAPEPDERREAVLARFTELVGADAVVESHIDPGVELWIRIDASAWRRAHQVLRHELGFKFFEFLSAIDWMPSPWGKSEDAGVDDNESAEPAEMTTGVAGGDTRFQIFSRVVRIEDKDLGVVLKADLPDPREDETSAVESILAVYPGANWHERETHEMFGIRFDGHPYLEALYLPTDFEGNPLRKDFPLLARHIKPWPGIVDVEPMPAGDDDDDAGDDA